MMLLPEYGALFPGFLEVRRTRGYGRGVYTRQRLPIGRELLSADPVTHVLNSQERGLRCDCCLERCEHLQRCGACKFVRYCSKTCQRSDWFQHKAECKGISRIHPKVPTDTMRLLARLIVKREASISKSPKPGLPDGAQWSLDLLGSHTPGYSDELKTSLAEQVMGARLLLEEEKEIFDAQVAFEIACKLMSNSYCILDAEMNSIGGAVYIEPAMFNHSCEPNTVALFTGTQIHLRCIKEISEGEQALVSYIDVVNTRERRQRQLYKSYQFTCECSRCGMEPAEGTVDRMLSSTATDLSDVEGKKYMAGGFQLLEEAEKLKKSANWLDLLHLCDQYLKENLGVLGDMNVVTVKMRECLLDSYIELGQWREGLTIAKLLQPAYEFYLDKYSPLRGIHLYRTAKLIHQVSDVTEDLKISTTLLDQAVGVLTVTHGHTHSLVQEARGLLTDVQTELTRRLH